MTYLLAALAGAFGIILLVLLGVQQLLVFIQIWQKRPDFDSSTVLQAARVAGLLMSGALLVFSALVVHWRFAHGRSDWDWGLILGHVDAENGDLVEEAAGDQPSATGEVDSYCLERCMAFCLENDD